MSEQRSETHPHHIRILDYTNSFLFYIFDQVSSRLFCFGFFLTQGRIFPMRHRDRMLSVSISFPCDFFYLNSRFCVSYSHPHTHTQPAADEEVEVLSYWQLSVSSPFNVRNYIQLFTKLFHLSLRKIARNPLLMDTTCCCGGHRFIKVDTKGLRNEEKLERYPSLILTGKSLCAMQRNREKKSTSILDMMNDSIVVSPPP